MDMRVDDVLISAEEGCQAAARARQERSGPGHHPRQLQIITAGLVPPGSHGSGITGHSGPPARRGHA